MDPAVIIPLVDKRDIAYAKVIGGGLTWEKIQGRKIGENERQIARDLGISEEEELIIDSSNPGAILSRYAL